YANLPTMSTDPNLEHFGLREPPFLLAPDPEFLHLSTQHSLAQAYLSYALLNRDSFVVLTGETGTGKTTLINKLISAAGQKVVIARIAHSQLTPLELLQAILLTFGIRAFDKQKVELLTMLEDFINEQYQQKRQVLIVVDDAHNLGVDVLEEVRLVTQLVTRKDAAVNLILSGRPSLRDVLELPVLEQLRQRIRFNFQLKPLSAQETADFITKRLEVAGATRDIFAPQCLHTVFEYTGGIPRLINILCDTALMSAYTEGAPDVQADTLQTAIEELDWQPIDEDDFSSTDDIEIGVAENDPVPDLAQTPALEDVTHVAPDDDAAADVEVDVDASPIASLASLRGGSSQEARAAAARVPSSDTTRASFQLFRDEEPVGEHRLEGERLTIGRDSDNSIQINAEYVSRHHAQVSWLRGGCWIADLNSTNGTFVNGLRVRRRLLRDGDEIQFGRHRLRVHCASPSAEAVEADNDDRWRETLVIPEDQAQKA
ncbi:MAG: AAA family ATPase, partial [Pseudomonadota bacterium]